MRIAKPSVETTRNPLILFHPTPASGGYFTEFMALMATDRVVIAIDAPGYGDSTRPATIPSIDDYATSAAMVLEELGFGSEDSERVDALGYHTGGLIAVELARSRPSLVRRLVLPGLPFFTGETRRELYERTTVPAPEVARDGSHLMQVWDHATIAVDAGVPLARAQELFAEEIKSYPYGWWGYHAAFTYESDLRFREVAQPVLLISTVGGLQEATAAAAEHFEAATYVHLQDYTFGVFVVGVDALAAEARKFLDD
ncbi:MAG: alpha/beta fold hydrolase [Woeseiaceae bacterium]|nr:alpha/beta fold hydrolase [Woeseiaceae bacterium]